MFTNYVTECGIINMYKGVKIMEYDINVRVSNRHVHLTKETYDILFDEEITKKYDLNQVGEFASNQTLTLRNGEKTIENVRVCGPFRNYNQIELSRRDARSLDMFPPVRRSGDLSDSLDIILETSKGCVKTNGVIIMSRHVHMTKEDAIKYGVVNEQVVGIKIDNEKGGIAMAEVKISDNGYYEVHFDTDDANAFLINDNDKAKMII